MGGPRKQSKLMKVDSQSKKKLWIKEFGECAFISKQHIFTGRQASYKNASCKVDYKYAGLKIILNALIDMFQQTVFCKNIGSFILFDVN